MSARVVSVRTKVSFSPMPMSYRKSMRFSRLVSSVLMEKGGVAAERRVIVVQRAEPGSPADEGVVVFVAALGVREADLALQLICAVRARDARPGREERLAGVAEKEAATELVLHGPADVLRGERARVEREQREGDEREQARTRTARGAPAGETEWHGAQVIDLAGCMNP
jgi:hypothetical protein